MTEVKGCLKKSIIIVFLAIIGGYALLVLVNMIPVSLMKKQKIDAAQMMEQTTVRELDPYSGRKIDNFADSLIVLLATYDGKENSFEKAANDYYWNEKDSTPLDALVGITLKNDKGIRDTNSRYWHGSLVLLKPLFVFLDFSVMRDFNTVVLFFFTIILLIFMQRKLTQATIPFALMMLLIAPTTVGQCFEYTFVCHIMLISSIAYLWNPKGFFLDERVYYLFLFSGILLAYFDLLTAPTITLTFPLALVCLKEKRSWKSLVLCAVFWLIGYSGMWAGKWVIALISQRGEFLTPLIEKMILWTAPEMPDTGRAISRIGALNLNFAVLFQEKYVNMAMVSYGGVAIINSIINCRKLSLENINKCISLYFPVVICMAWILIMASHSAVHFVFTYRNLAPCMFCLLCALDLGNVTAKGN